MSRLSLDLRNKDLMREPIFMLLSALQHEISTHIKMFLMLKWNILTQIVDQGRCCVQCVTKSGKKFTQPIVRIFLEYSMFKIEYEHDFPQT